MTPILWVRPSSPEPSLQALSWPELSSLPPSSAPPSSCPSPAPSPRAHRSVQSLLPASRSEEHTSELQSLMRISYAVFCLKKKHPQKLHHNNIQLIFQFPTYTLSVR